MEFDSTYLSPDAAAVAGRLAAASASAVAIGVSSVVVSWTRISSETTPPTGSGDKQYANHGLRIIIDSNDSTTPPNLELCLSASKLLCELADLFLGCVELRRQIGVSAENGNTHNKEVG